MKLRYFSHQAFREWNAVVPVTITATSKNSTNPFFSYMIMRIDESINNQTATKKATPASPPSPAGETFDSTPGWSIKDALASIMAIIRSRPETSSDAP